MNIKFTGSVSVVGAALLFASSPAASQILSMDSSANSLVSQKVSLKVGESFLKARSRIISGGWTPARMHDDDGYEFSGTEKELEAKQILEIDTCSVDAGVLCIFYYRKREQCLRVDTVGEEVAKMTVSRWVKECPVEDR